MFPKEFQQKNHQLVVDNLQKSHELIENLIHKTYRQQDAFTTSELRQIRNKTSGLISDIQDKNVDSFNSRQGNLEDFYKAEELFVENSRNLLINIQKALDSDVVVDTFSLDRSLDDVKVSLKNRVVPTKELLLEHETERKKQQPEQVENNSNKFESNSASTNESSVVSVEMNEFEDQELLPKFYNYINILEEKYSKFQPEISHNGDYIADKDWKFDVTKRSVVGTVKDGMFRKTLLIETYWHPLKQTQDVVEYVQTLASEVGGNQYRSLCLVANVWNDDIKEFARGFIHSRMSLFLYELKNDVLIFNETSTSAKRFMFWHSPEKEKKTIEQVMDSFIEEVEYFTLDDLEMKFELNQGGAKKFIDKLLKKRIVIDVGLESPKYVKTKHI